MATGDFKKTVKDYMSHSTVPQLCKFAKRCGRSLPQPCISEIYTLVTVGARLAPMHPPLDHSGCPKRP